jgi:hypothetical protein
VNPTVNPLHYNRALGIDLRANQVEVACVSTRWGRLRSIETAICPAPGDESARLRRVHDLLKGKGWTELPCLIALHGESTVLRSIPARTSDPQAIQGIVEREFENFKGLQSHEMIRGCTFIPGGDGHPRIVLALTRSEVAEQAAHAANQLHQRLTGLIPGAVALFNTWNRLAPETDRRCLLINVGQQLTEIVICTQNELLFARSFSAHFPLDAIDKDGQQNWWTALRTCLDIYQGEDSGDDVNPQEVYLSGNAANDTLHDKIAALLGIPVFRTAALDIEPPFEAAMVAPIATGLAMAGVKQAAVELSLLPRALRDKRCLQWQLQYWGLACVILLSTLLSIYGLMHWSQDMKSDVLEAKKHQLRQMKKESLELDGVEIDNALLRDQIAPLRVAIHNDAIMHALMNHLSEAKHPDDWISLVADAYSYNEPPPRPGPEGELTQAPASLGEGLELRHVIVEGYTPIDDLSTVNSMIETLREKESILEVDLLGDERLRSDALRDARWLPFNARLFAIEISVRSS